MTNKASMRMNRTLTLAMVSAIALATAACETDLTALNENPNNPTTAPAGPLFTQATISAVQNFAGNGGASGLSGTNLFAQHIAQVQYVDEDRGHLRPGNIDAQFANPYIGSLEDLEKVAQQGIANTSPRTTGPARVMQSWQFQNLTDMFGDIPYSEALKGDVVGGPTKPKYDMQKDVYYGVLATLTAATTSMSAAPASDGGLAGADPIYAGSNALWIKFSNSLRARMAMRMSKADPAKATAELAAAFAAPGGVFTSNADNARLVWPGDGVFDNPWSANFSGRDDHRVSRSLLDTMVTLGDPRVPIYAQPTKADPTKYAGLQNGLNNVTVTPFFNTTSRIGAIFYPGSTVYGVFGTSAGKRTPSYLMTYSEVAFIRAEAANRGIGGLTAAQAAAFYDAGVTASITQWGGTAAQAAAYLAMPGVAYAGGATGLQQIGLQKWIALYTQGTEAWSEWRRTGNPSHLKMGPAAYSDVPTMPRRIPYSTAEQGVNKDALAVAVGRQGADTYLTRVWWDK